MPKRKLLKRQVEDIFNQYYYEGRDEFWLADLYDVAPETVLDIINRRTWRKLELKTPAEIRAERMIIARGYDELMADGHSIFEVAMLARKTPHEITEELKWYRNIERATK